MALSKVGLYGPATTDTAAGDNAAIGYTASEGLILTGQGSTSDITIKNDADSTIASVATGTTVLDFQNNVTLQDDKGILFGTGSDFALGANGGETEFVISKGSTTTGGTTGKWTFIPTTDGVYVDLFGTEGKGPAHGLYQDDGDDNDDLWRYGQGSSDGDANGIISWSHYGTGSWTHKMRIYTTGNFATSGTHAASQSFDYAEFVVNDLLSFFIILKSSSNSKQENKT